MVIIFFTKMAYPLTCPIHSLIFYVLAQSSLLDESYVYFNFFRSVSAFKRCLRLVADLKHLSCKESFFDLGKKN